jgi:transposase
VRVQTAFNRVLRLPGASVIDVCLGGEGVIVCVRLRRRRRVCWGCGQTGRHLHVHDRRVKRWRHLDLGANGCVIERELRRLRCPACGVRSEPVPWARPEAHHTRDLKDVLAWLAQQIAKTAITGLLRIGWDTVERIVERVVADHLDETRLDGLVAIGVDEISYRRGQRLPHQRRRSRQRRDRVLLTRSQRRDVAGVLRRARRPTPVNPGSLDRHQRQLRQGDPRQRPAGRDLL